MLYFQWQNAFSILLVYIKIGVEETLVWGEGREKAEGKPGVFFRNVSVLMHI